MRIRIKRGISSPEETREVLRKKATAFFKELRAVGEWKAEPWLLDMAEKQVQRYLDNADFGSKTK